MRKRNKLIETEHVGKRIKQALDESNMNVVDFAKAICCSRTNIYDIFRREAIDTEKLLLISKVLNMPLTEFLRNEKKSRGKYIIVAETDYDTMKLLEEKGLKVKSWRLN